MKKIKSKSIKKCILKLIKKIDRAKSRTQCTVDFNDIISITGTSRCDNGISKIYDVRAYIETKPFSKKRGWCCFYSRSVKSPKKLDKKIIKSLHRYLGVNYEM